MFITKEHGKQYGNNERICSKCKPDATSILKSEPLKKYNRMLLCEGIVGSFDYKVGYMVEDSSTTSLLRWFKAYPPRYETASDGFHAAVSCDGNCLSGRGVIAYLENFLEGIIPGLDSERYGIVLAGFQVSYPLACCSPGGWRTGWERARHSRLQSGSGAWRPCFPALPSRYSRSVLPCSCWAGPANLPACMKAVAESICN